MPLPHRDNLKGKTVLIEGTDLAGKTTLQKELTTELQEVRLPVVANKFALVPNPYMTEALHLIYTDWAAHQERINFLLAQSAIYDGIAFQKPSAAIFVQDSYIQRTLAFCEVMGIHSALNYLRANQQKFPVFDITIYLCADTQVKRNRYLKKECKDGFDFWIFEHPERFEAMDSILESELAHTPNYLKIDTTQLTPGAVVRTTLEHFSEVAR